MTNLLKKDNFKWSEDSKASFETLKAAMIKAPVLAFPDFEKKFILETDACNSGVRAVLIHARRSYYFFLQLLNIWKNCRCFNLHKGDVCNHTISP